MPAIVPGYEYDIFISYRQNDNKRDGWVTQFVAALKDELEATLKNPVSIYFDENPHDGLLETHQVNASLEKKLKCLVFIPIISQTYCDTSSFAWEHEFLAFNRMAREDELGMNISLKNGNVASRVLPVKIHELDDQDKQVIEHELGGPLRCIDFIYSEPGVNRPLNPDDSEDKNLNRTRYKNQINKVANALKEVGNALVAEHSNEKDDIKTTTEAKSPKKAKLQHELISRNVFQAGLMYVIIGMLVWKVGAFAVSWFELPDILNYILASSLLLLFPIAIVLAYIYENSPEGFIKTSSKAASENPFTLQQKKPFTSNLNILVLLVTTIILFLVFPQKGIFGPEAGIEASEASIAILPLYNNTGNKALDHYGIGLASEIRTRLAVSKAFDFISAMQGTMKYMSSMETPIKIGEDLGVTHILTGMYQGTEDNLQVIIELVESGTGKMVWNLTYQSEYNDLFNLQASIGNKVMEKFNSKSTEQVTKSFNMEAFAQYIEGMRISSFRGMPKERLRAVPYFENAIRLDSTLLSAWVGLVENLAFHYWLLPNDTTVTLEQIQLLMTYVDTHFEESWETNFVKGINSYWVERDYEKGKQYFEEVLKENPESSGANSLLGAIYKRRLETREALKYASKAAQLDNTGMSWSELGIILRNNGDYEGAETAFMKEVQENVVSGYGFYYRLMRDQQRLEELPESTKKAYDKIYRADLYIQRREYTALLEYLKNVETDSNFNILYPPVYNAVGYFGLNQIDSAKHYAEQYFMLRNKYPDLTQYELGGFPPYDFNISMHGILGDREELGHPIYLPEKQLAQDKEARIIVERVNILNLALRGDYEEATKRLKRLNKEYPDFGNYAFLNSSPLLDKIKKEYPPFQEALNNVILPPKATEIDRQKM